MVSPIIGAFIAQATKESMDRDEAARQKYLSDEKHKQALELEKERSKVNLETARIAARSREESSKITATSREAVAGQEMDKKYHDKWITGEFSKSDIFVDPTIKKSTLLNHQDNLTAIGKTIQRITGIIDLSEAHNVKAREILKKTNIENFSTEMSKKVTNGDVAPSSLGSINSSGEFVPKSGMTQYGFSEAQLKAWYNVAKGSFSQTTEGYTADRKNWSAMKLLHSQGEGADPGDFYEFYERRHGETTAVKNWKQMNEGTEKYVSKKVPKIGPLGQRSEVSQLIINPNWTSFEKYMLTYKFKDKKSLMDNLKEHLKDIRSGKIRPEELFDLKGQPSLLIKDIVDNLPEFKKFSLEEKRQWALKIAKIGESEHHNGQKKELLEVAGKSSSVPLSVHFPFFSGSTALMQVDDLKTLDDNKRSSTNFFTNLSNQVMQNIVKETSALTKGKSKKEIADKLLEKSTETISGIKNALISDPSLLYAIGNALKGQEMPITERDADLIRDGGTVKRETRLYDFRNNFPILSIIFDDMYNDGKGHTRLKIPELPNSLQKKAGGIVIGTDTLTTSTGETRVVPRFAYQTMHLNPVEQLSLMEDEKRLRDPENKQYLLAVRGPKKQDGKHDPSKSITGHMNTDAIKNATTWILDNNATLSDVQGLYAQTGNMYLLSLRTGEEYIRNTGIGDRWTRERVDAGPLDKETIEDPNSKYSLQGKSIKGLRQLEEMAKLLSVKMQKLTRYASSDDTLVERMKALRKGTGIAANVSQFMLSVGYVVDDFKNLFSSTDNPFSMLFNDSGDFNHLSIEDQLKDNDYISNSNKASLRKLHQKYSKSIEALRANKNLSDHQFAIRAALEFEKVAFTYKLAGLVQGDQTGGRTISNQDFDVIFKSLWGVAGHTGAANIANILRITQHRRAMAEQEQNLWRRLGKEPTKLRALNDSILYNSMKEFYGKFGPTSTSVSENITPNDILSGQVRLGGSSSTPEGEKVLDNIMKSISEENKGIIPSQDVPEQVNNNLNKLAKILEPEATDGLTLLSNVTQKIAGAIRTQRVDIDDKTLNTFYTLFGYLQDGTLVFKVGNDTIEKKDTDIINSNADWFNMTDKDDSKIHDKQDWMDMLRNLIVAYHELVVKTKWSD